MTGSGPAKLKAANLTAERILGSILLLRNDKVLLDADLASLYAVKTRVLIQAVKRNLDRFPDDFMFQVTREEFAFLKSQSVISSSWGGRRTLPYAFTEQGVAMLSSVLRSGRSVSVNIEIMRAFVKLRAMLTTHAELVRKLNQLEQRYDSQFKAVFDAIRSLMAPPTAQQKRIGFNPAKKK